MVKKKSGMARRRKKSNTTTNEGAKRSKTAKQENPAEYRNGLLQGIRALLGKMDDKELVALMAYGVSTMEDKQKSTSLQPSMTVSDGDSEGRSDSNSNRYSNSKYNSRSSEFYNY